MVEGEGCLSEGSVVFSDAVAFMTEILGGERERERHKADYLSLVGSPAENTAERDKPLWGVISFTGGGERSVTVTR